MHDALAWRAVPCMRCIWLDTGHERLCHLLVALQTLADVNKHNKQTLAHES